MRKMLVAGALALSAISAPAMAIAPYFQNGGSAAFNAPIPNSSLTINFGPGAGNPQAVYPGPGSFTGAGSGVYDTAVLVPGTAARPAFGSAGGFASVLAGGSYTIDLFAILGTSVQVFSFVLGSLDDTNAVELFFDNGTSQTFAGPVLNGGVAQGNQTINTQNGRVIFDAAGVAGFGIRKAIFTSNTNSFEFDNIVVAIPEPAAWGMLLLGFGLVGGALRTRRRSPALATT